MTWCIDFLPIRVGRLSGCLTATIARRLERASAYAAASEAAVSWAFRPLGLGTTHELGALERLRPAGPSTALRVAEGLAVRRDPGDRDHPRAALADQRAEPAAARAQLGARSARRPGPWPEARGW